jgi:hypothetical protein
MNDAVSEAYYTMSYVTGMQERLLVTVHKLQRYMTPRPSAQRGDGANRVYCEVTQLRLKVSQHPYTKICSVRKETGCRPYHHTENSTKEG